MKKIVTSFAALSLVFALALTFAAPASAQLTGGSAGVNATTTTGTSGTDASATATTTTGGTMDSTSGSMDDTTSPGLPNTGAGGDVATTVAILMATGLLAIAGTVLAARKLAV